MRNNALSVPLVSSCLIHLAVLLLGSILIHNTRLHRQDFLPISLVDLPKTEPAPIRQIQTPQEIKQSPAKAEKPKETKSVVKNEPAKIERTPAPTLAPAKEEPLKAPEMKAPAKVEPAPSIASSARTEGGGSEAGAGNLFGKGDVGVVPGSGTAGGGGGTAASGLGRGLGAPGLPVQTAPLRTNREAKPIQTARASYPPMALRMGMEADVTLRIIVDPEGNVTRADIAKSGGGGFDEEALKAVRQSRFEPAQKDGQNVPAEFTFIYRFRLQR
jgi:periplasmic protein TonB